MKLMQHLTIAVLGVTPLIAAPNYPPSKRVPLTEEMFGQPVPDDYRWLEDDRSEETAAWVKAQNEVTSEFLGALPGRAEIAGRLKELWNFERIGTPRKFGENWFFNYNSGLMNQSQLRVASDPKSEGRVLLDPNAWKGNGTVALAEWVPSEDGTLLAYSISRGGSDWREIRVRDVAEGSDLEDVLRWVKFSSIAWAHDGSGFYYSRYDEPGEGSELTGRNEFQKLCFHQLGTPQASDRVIFENPQEPKWGFGAGLTEDGNYLIISVSDGTGVRNRVYFQEQNRPGAAVTPLVPEPIARFRFLGNVGSKMMFLTNEDAPRFRVIEIDAEHPEKSAWRELVAESSDQLAGASAVGGQLVLEYLRDAKSAVKCVTLEGEWLRELELPGIGSVGGFGGRMDDQETFYSFTSFTEPGAIFRLDLATGHSEKFREAKVDFDSAAYVTRQEFVTSKDGTKVPMFIVHKRGIELDGSAKTIVYGYGGFHISMQPGFSVSRAVWLERGGVLAVANLRGGGEYGTAWHEAGTKLQKQNVFDDMIACSEWLVANNYTKPASLAVQGGSNGGLLVGAMMTQRPDLFGAALPAVGVMDMLRFHKFTIGWAWETDYGSPEKADEFAALYQYSPYHQLRDGTRYPATLVTTADHDDRVVPAHSFKFAARLQAAQSEDGPPVLIRIDTSAGHGAGTALDKVIARVADEWAFLEAELE